MLVKLQAVLVKEPKGAESPVGRIISARESASGRENSPDTKDCQHWWQRLGAVFGGGKNFPAARLLQMPKLKTTARKQTIWPLEIHAPFHTTAF